jgi:hypothetical protein
MVSVAVIRDWIIVERIVFLAIPGARKIKSVYQTQPH